MHRLCSNEFIQWISGCDKLGKKFDYVYLVTLCSIQQHFRFEGQLLAKLALCVSEVGEFLNTKKFTICKFKSGSTSSCRF